MLQSLQPNIKDIINTFMFLGCGPECLKAKGASLDKVYCLLGSTTLANNVRLVGRPITYEAMFENWGECQETEALSQGFYYQHPNSVSLYLSIVDKMCIMPL